MTDLPFFIDILTKGGLLAGLIIALWGGMNEWYIWGKLHRSILQKQQEDTKEALKQRDDSHKEALLQRDAIIADLKKDRDYWKDYAFRVMDKTERITGIYEASSRTGSRNE